jgi:hypothetical protein
MDEKTKKRFTMLAAAGLLVARGVPAIATQSNVADRLDTALQEARDELRLSLDDIDALSALEAGEADMMVALY